jgi:hypothetical protein
MTRTALSNKNIVWSMPVTSNSLIATLKSKTDEVILIFYLSNMSKINI